MIDRFRVNPQPGGGLQILFEHGAQMRSLTLDSLGRELVCNPNAAPDLTDFCALLLVLGAEELGEAQRHAVYTHLAFVSHRLHGPGLAELVYFLKERRAELPASLLATALAALTRLDPDAASELGRIAELCGLTSA